MADEGDTSKTQLSVPGNSEGIRKGLVPLRPKEFFSPSSFKASKDDLSSRGLWPALMAGPLRPLLKGASFVRGDKRGDQDTRYLALWSLRRVVFISGVQTEFTKIGSKSSVGAGVRQAQTEAQAPIWLSKLGGVVWNLRLEAFVRVRRGNPTWVVPLSKLRGLNPSLSPSRALCWEARPEKGRLKTPPLDSLYEG